MQLSIPHRRTYELSLLNCQINTVRHLSCYSSLSDKSETQDWDSCKVQHLTASHISYYTALTLQTAISFWTDRLIMAYHIWGVCYISIFDLANNTVSFVSFKGKLMKKRVCRTFRYCLWYFQLIDSFMSCLVNNSDADTYVCLFWLS